MSPYDQRLDHLLRTAARVFADKGYHATTMRDLARATGMSLAGMYYYVRSKEDLLFQVQDRCFARVLTGAREALDGLTDPVERLRAFLHHHVTFFADHMAEMKVLSHEAESLRGEGARRLREAKRAYAALLEDLLRDAAAEVSDAERAVTAYALFGMVNWLYTWYRPEGEVAPEELAERFTQIALHGVIAGAAAPASTAHGG